jgi:hypothetical protein
MEASFLESSRSTPKTGVLGFASPAFSGYVYLHKTSMMSCI